MWYLVSSHCGILNIRYKIFFWQVNILTHFFLHL